MTSRLAFFHFHEPDGTVTAKCRGLKDWKASSPSLAQSKNTADAEARRRLDGDVRVEHFERVGFDWWRPA